MSTNGTLRVLYAEDSLPDADLTRTLFELEAPELEIDVAETGQRCLALLTAGRYDALLLDNHLPDMDGVDVLRELVSRDIQLPVVMVTGLGDEELVVQALRLGACDYVPKQGNYVASLPAILKDAIAGDRARRQRQDASGRGRRRILYVEHHAADIDLTIQRFAEVGAQFVVDVARSSEQGLRLLRERTFDLVLTDLRLPDMMGLDFLQAARRAGARVPFIVITGKGDEGTAVAALKVGAYDYIVKRDDYLTQLPYAIENAIARFELEELNGRLQAELAERERSERARAQLESQFQHAQKMESIGRLAGGVAHDFNNLVTAINGYADLMLQEIQEGDPLRAGLLEIRRAGDRAADLTRQLLALSRRQLLQPRVVTLNSLIADHGGMLQRLLGEDIELVTILDPALGQVRADPGQVHQVILNLAVNARDAMSEGGTLTIETRNVELDAEYAQQHVSLQPGPYVMLVVSDTGSGMDAETLSHTFEPFFTTKEQGKGTGLGLSTVYGIVRQSGGSIWVYSEPGRGTTFKVYLPRISETVAEPAGAQGRSARVLGTETILVVEDEELVRNVTCAALRRYGYTVLDAANGGEALLACERYTGPIHIMVTDVVMPNMSGRELAARLRPLRPDMPVLYMSGYTDDAIVRQGLVEAATYFIQKPFAPGTLAQRLRDILDQRTPPASS